MDQRTANIIAIIKTLTPAVIAGGFGVAIVILAYTRDGEYASIIGNLFPYIIIACLGALGIQGLVENAAATIQAKYQSQTTAPPPPPAPEGAPALAVPAAPVAPAAVPSVPALPGPSAPAPADGAPPLMGA